MRVIAVIATLYPFRNRGRLSILERVGVSWYSTINGGIRSIQFLGNLIESSVAC